MDDHSSGACVAAGFSRPTRATGRECPCVHPVRGQDHAGRPYSALLPVGFAVPPTLPWERCALTAPFHPCRGTCPLRGACRGGLLSVALSLGFDPRRSLTGTVFPWSPDFPPAPCSEEHRDQRSPSHPAPRVTSPLRAPRSIASAVQSRRPAPIRRPGPPLPAARASPHPPGHPPAPAPSGAGKRAKARAGAGRCGSRCGPAGSAHPSSA